MSILFTDRDSSPFSFTNPWSLCVCIYYNIAFLLLASFTSKAWGKRKEKWCMQTASVYWWKWKRKEMRTISKWTWATSTSYKDTVYVSNSFSEGLLSVGQVDSALGAVTALMDGATRSSTSSERVSNDAFTARRLSFWPLLLTTSATTPRLS